jgi:predicted aspartyl protease
MHFSKRACALMILTFAVLGGVHSAAQPARHSKKPKPTPEEIAQADHLFQSGSFGEAQRAYADIAAQDPKDFHAASQLGHIALLSNKLDDAEPWLRKALDLKHGDADAKIMLAETLYRKNDFFHAARALQGLGPDDAKLKNYLTLNEAKLESFRDEDPYKFERDAGESTRLPFIKSDPLPVVNVRVNGGRDVAFFIDTGGSELLLDSEFSRELNVKPMSSVEGTFSGGQHAQVESGRVDSLTLGSWTLRNIPVGMMPLRSLSSGFGVKQINGCIGTNVLYQFLSTIDYRTGELILRKKNAANLKRFDAAGGPSGAPGVGRRSGGRNTQPKNPPGANNTAVTNGIVVPMWMAGDHFMVAWGRVNTQPISLFFVDSGLAGAGVKLAESAIQQAGIHLDESKATEGQGGGGMLKIIPYTVAQFTVGEITEQNVPGLYDGPFPWENEFGFHLAGMFGSDFLKHYAVTFDFTNMRIIFR